MKRSCNHSGHTHTFIVVSLGEKRTLKWCARCGALGSWNTITGKRRWIKPKLASDGGDHG